MKNKKILVSVLGILGIIFTTAGITYAFYSYSKTGTKSNVITSGAITFRYVEGSRKIGLTDVMPMTDEEGKAQDDYFEFTVNSTTPRDIEVPYYITVRKQTGANILSDDIVKVYLTKVSGNVETEIRLAKFSDLTQYHNDLINIPNTEKTLYNDTVNSGSANYAQVYRLRMWVDTSANYIVQENGQDTYPLQGKSYSLTVNIYGEGNVAGPAIGEPMTIGEEEFYYIGTTETGDLKLFAKYNLNVHDSNIEQSSTGLNSNVLEGIQDESIKGFDIKDDGPNYGSVQFADSAYWSSDNLTYPADVYTNEKVNGDYKASIAEYVDNYVNYLKEINAKVKSGRLITHSELTNDLGCTFNSCGDNTWVFNTTYWTGTASASEHSNIIRVLNSGIIDDYGYEANWYKFHGVRPVIIVEK